MSTAEEIQHRLDAYNLGAAVERQNWCDVVNDLARGEGDRTEGDYYDALQELADVMGIEVDT